MTDPIGVSLRLPCGADCADLGGEIGALLVDKREKRGDNREDSKKADKSRCDGRNSVVERPEEDEHSGEEECQGELKEDGDGTDDVLDAPHSKII